MLNFLQRVTGNFNGKAMKEALQHFLAPNNISRKIIQWEFQLIKVFTTVVLCFTFSHLLKISNYISAQDILYTQQRVQCFVFLCIGEDPEILLIPISTKFWCTYIALVCKWSGLLGEFLRT